MADGKNIEVKLVATGGDQAAGEVRKLTTATDQAAAATRGFGGMLDSTAPEVVEVEQAAAAAAPEVVELSEAFQEAEARAEKLLKSLEETAAATDEIGEASEEVAPKVDQVITLQKIQIAQQLGQVLGQMGQQMRAIGKDFEATNPEIAGTLDGVGRSADVASAALTGMATGAFFGSAIPVVGTAAGAIIGGTLAGGMAVVKQGTEGLVDSLQTLSRIQQEAADLQDRITNLQVEFEGKVLNSKVEETYQKQTAALKLLLKELADTDQLLNAKESVEIIARNNADAQAIRNGEDPLRVQANRVPFDAQMEKNKIDRQLEAKRVEFDNLFKTAGDMAEKAISVKNTPGVSESDIAAAKARADEAKAASDKAKDALQQASQIGGFRKQGIDMEAQEKVAALVSKQAEQMTKKRQDDERKAELAAKKQVADNDKGLRGELRDRKAGLNETAMEGGRGFAEAGERSGNWILSKVGKSLANGTNDKEINELTTLVENNMAKLGQANATAIRKLMAELASQSREIEALSGQIKNSRRD